MFHLEIMTTTVHTLLEINLLSELPYVSKLVDTCLKVYTDVLPKFLITLIINWYKQM